MIGMSSVMGGLRKVYFEAGGINSVKEAVW